MKCFSEITKVESIDRKRNLAVLENGGLINVKPNTIDGKVVYMRWSGNGGYVLHKQSDNPVKVKKQHFGLFGQMLVVDLDKLEVMNDVEPIVKVAT